jgi:hypothetical protein
MLDARPGFIIKFLKRSLIVNLFKAQAFDCQSAVFDISLYLSKTADCRLAVSETTFIYEAVTEKPQVANMSTVEPLLSGPHRAATLY